VVKIFYLHTWPDLPRNENLFTLLINGKSAQESENYRSLAKVKILVEGVYKPNPTNFRSRFAKIFDDIYKLHLYYKSDFKIQVITEAYPLSNSHKYDLNLSNDSTNENSNNLYFPLWYLLPGILGEGIPLSMENRFGTYPNISFYLSGRSGIEKNDFATRTFGLSYIRNIDNTRFSDLTYLSNNFGLKNISSLKRNSVNYLKSSRINQSKFIYCPENTNFPGYVTEKIFEAYACGAIPIWRGVDSEGFLNKKSYINLNDYTSIEDFALIFNELSTNLDYYNTFFCEPLLKKAPDVNFVLNFINERIKIV
jgi:hypothetical protein